MMASMVAKVSGSCTSQLSLLSVQEKGSRNKRKFCADPPISGDVSTVLPSVLNDGLTYEFLAEKFEISAGHEQLPSPCDACGAYQDHSEALKLDLGLSSVVVEGSHEMCPSCPGDEGEADDLHDADWSDLTEGQLEDLVLSNLDTIFKGAIKKVVACGYTEEVAIKAVLRPDICKGSKDTVSNIVDNALAILRNGQDTDPSREYCFEDLQQLAKYLLAELVCVLQEFRPSFSTGDAMWRLLICDMNVSHACAMDGDPLSGLIIDGSSNGGSSSTLQHQSKAEPKSPEMGLPDSRKTIPTIHCDHASQSDVDTVTKTNNPTPPSRLESEIEGAAPSSSNAVEKPCCAGITQIPGMEERIVSSRKVHSTSSKILRQKSLHLEKSYRGGGTKGAFRAAKFSGFILDKRYKSVTDSAGLNLKSASVKISKAMAMGVQLAQEHGALNLSTSSDFTCSPLFNLDTPSTISALPKTDNAPADPLVKPIPPMPVADTELSLSLPAKSNTPQVNMRDNTEVPNSSPVGLPCDRSLAQFVPQGEKDEMIMKLIPRIRELQNQLQEWTEWANQKVMQAARRLSKDKAELKALRQEKEEVERLRKEKQSFEDNTMNKLSEMENALGKASGQVGRANAAVRRLELENAALRREMEVAKLRAAESAASCQEVSKREKKMLTKFHSWEKQKSKFQEELAAERRQLSQLQQELEQAKDLQNQLENVTDSSRQKSLATMVDEFRDKQEANIHPAKIISRLPRWKNKTLQARWKQEEKAKEELHTWANSTRKERERLVASVKRKEEAVRLKAEANLQKYKEGIQKLEKQISQLRLKADSSRIAALKRGINGGMVTDSQASPHLKESRDLFTGNGCHFSSTGGVKRERECVMCLSEEMSVVFLPCAHQVVCKMCNELHEKQGMNDCPSCRSPIEQRICVRYAHP
ncbi:hypothetical protein Cgig2_007033 [Carnegiea gigantea]|uniref:RING-type domain-containing protein n=1 Tax=Carnegiea gigantea TaxID=171969 RepID=A0A9Q1QFD1_9CARY|nr:hypothetical protein Cgig2_007033 [Carnegiea gigantea]